VPRLVTHIDERAIVGVGMLYDDWASIDHLVRPVDVLAEVVQVLRPVGCRCARSLTGGGRQS